MSHSISPSRSLGAHWYSRLPQQQLHEAPQDLQDSEPLKIDLMAPLAPTRALIYPQQKLHVPQEACHSPAQRYCFVFSDPARRLFHQHSPSSRRNHNVTATSINLWRTAISQNAELHIIPTTAQRLKHILLLSLARQTRMNQIYVPFLTLNTQGSPQTDWFLPAQGIRSKEINVHNTNFDVPMPQA